MGLLSGLTRGSTPARRRASRCWRCGKETTVLTRTSDTHSVCPDCLGRYYEKCYACGEYADRDEILVNCGLCEYCVDDEDY